MTQMPERPNPELAAGLDVVLEAALAEHRVAGAVALVAKRGELVYARAAGFADLERDAAMSQDAIFLAASLTKPIVTAAFLTLVDESAMGLDDLVTQYLPTFAPRFEGEAPAITLRQLLTHTSGLSYSLLQPDDGPYVRLGVSNGVDYPGLGLAEALGRIVEAGLTFPPGQAWLYSVGLDVLGAAMEARTGKPLAQVVAERVTGPLGMRDSGFAVTDRARIVTAYADGPPLVRMGAEHVLPFAGLSGIRFAPDRIFDAVSYASGGGGMACTASDFLRFLEAIRSMSLPGLKAGTVEAMMRNQTGAQVLLTNGPGWGFGFGGAVLLDPIAASSPLPVGTWSWGGVYGHSWAVDPAREVSVVLMTNTTLEGRNGQLSRDLIAAALAD